MSKHTKRHRDWLRSLKHPVLKLFEPGKAVIKFPLSDRFTNTPPGRQLVHAYADGESVVVATGTIHTDHRITLNARAAYALREILNELLDPELSEQDWRYQAEIFRFGNSQTGHGLKAELRVFPPKYPNGVPESQYHDSTAFVPPHSSLVRFDASIPSSTENPQNP